MEESIVMQQVMKVQTQSMFQIRTLTSSRSGRQIWEQKELSTMLGYITDLMLAKSTSQASKLELEMLNTTKI
jgi:hypothetical protein